MARNAMARPWTRRDALRMLGGALALPLASGLHLPTSVAAEATPTPAPDTDTQLARMLSLTPDLIPDWNGHLSFANLIQAKDVHGFGDVYHAADLGDRTLTDFAAAINGCYVVNVAYTRPQSFADSFGYDLFQIDRELAMGLPPNVVTRLEGGFDPAAIQAKLMAGGYAEATSQGTTYATIRGDYQVDIAGSRAPSVLAHLNRVAYDDTRILTTAATASMVALIAGEQQTIPTLAMNPTYAALAHALGDVTSMAVTDTMDVKAGDFPIPAGYRDSLRDWGTLHPSLLVAMGYTDAGDDGRTMHVAIVYANPDDAAADAPELVKRLMSYRLLLTNAPLIPMYATGVTSRTETVMGRGTLVADVALTPEPARSRLWVQMFEARDILFLVPDPALRRTP